ncbi:MAG: LLM class flavin-dependent oxidoreductase [Gammaproteobacteria bacterium]|nr:LLM class flavin-dependent oxidoreductase [Gammaproteobacteria bacterium]
MRIGISIASAYGAADVRDGARQMIDRAAAAARGDLDSLFVGDHHVLPTAYYQNTPMLGRLLAEWDQRDAGALLLLPLWNPVLAAERIATLACITKGRFIMQCGLGRDEYQFNAMGADIRYRPVCLRTIARLPAPSVAWRRSQPRRPLEIQEGQNPPLPPEPIDVWIGASAPVAIDRAARLGDAWLADPSMTLEEAGKAIDIYKQALADHGKDIPDTIPIRRDIFVAENETEAERCPRIHPGEGLSRLP